MNAPETIDAILIATTQGDPEAIYNDDVDAYDYDDAADLLKALRDLNSQAPENLPTSFRDFIARYGYSQLGSFDLVMRIWALQLQPSPGWNPFDNPPFPDDMKVTVDGEPATIFEWVDNPGDAGSYEFLLVDPSKSPLDELWLYRGWDFAWKDGIMLAPLGVSFWEVAATCLSGLGDALFCPSNEKVGNISKLNATHYALHRNLLAGLEDLIEKTRALDFTCEGMDGPVSWSTELDKLTTRIAEIRQSVGEGGSLPFGRSSDQQS